MKNDNIWIIEHWVKNNSQEWIKLKISPFGITYLTKIAWIVNNKPQIFSTRKQAREWAIMYRNTARSNNKFVVVKYIRSEAPKVMQYY